MWGYADVGADIYTALGIVALAAAGFTPLAFLAAGLVYALVGLCYAELASAYPVAGGGQFFTLRGLGDVWGFIAGSALLLDYTIDIALFTVVSFGYLNYFLPYLTGERSPYPDPFARGAFVGLTVGHDRRHLTHVPEVIARLATLEGAVHAR